MADRFILSHLKRLPLFRLLTAEQFERLSEIVQVFRFEPGEWIFTQGNPAPGLVILAAGRAELMQAGLQGTYPVQPGAYFNEAALLADVPAPASLRALETAIVLLLPRQSIAALLAHYPEIRHNLQLQADASDGLADTRAFEAQRENETVLLETRRHIWALIRRVWLLVLLAAGLVLVVGLAGDSMPGFPGGTLLLMVLPILLVLVGYFYLEWRNDVLIVTDRRVVGIHRQILLFRTKINEIPLDGIQEVSAVLPVTDPIARLLGYGTLFVRTAGDLENLVVDYIPTPNAIQKTIFEHRQKFQEMQAEAARRANRDAIRADLARFIGQGQPVPPAPAAPAAPPAVERQPNGFLSTRMTGPNGESIYRKHWIVWVSHMSLPAIVLMAGLVLGLLTLFQTGGLTGLGTAGLVVSAVITLIGAGGVYLVDWDWRHDYYVISDQTIQLIHKRPLWLQDENDRVSLAQVDNVVSEISGVFGTLLNVGDVKLLLRGTETPKYFRQVHYPQAIQEEISRRQERAEIGQQEAEAARQRQAIVEYLSVYHEALGQPPSTPPPPGAPPPDQPPRVRDRSRPPGVPLVRRDPPQ